MKAVSGEGIVIKRSGFASKDANANMNERVCGSRIWEGKMICLCAVTQTGLELQGAYGKGAEEEKYQRKDWK